MIELSIKDYERLPMFKENKDIRIHGSQLYKRIDGIKGTNVDFIKFLRSIPKIPGVALPNHLLVAPGFIPMLGDKPYGYSMDLFEGCDVDYFLYYKYWYDTDTIKAIKAIFSILDNIHKYFIYGDIRNSNILITPSGPVFVDADNGKQIDDDCDAFCHYHVKVDGTTLDSNFISDNLKALICALTVYYGINVEKIYTTRINDMKYLLEILHDIKAPDAFIFYLDRLIEDALCNPGINPKSFEEYAQDLTPATKEDIGRLLRRI